MRKNKIKISSTLSLEKEKKERICAQNNQRDS
jgi:hypothetical protein